MRALIVGASAGVGRSLCEALATHGAELLLVASDARDLGALSAHLRLVYDAKVQTVAVDASRLSECVQAIHTEAKNFGVIDSLFFPIGASSMEDQGLLPISRVSAILDSNLTIVIDIVTHFLPQLMSQRQTNIVGFGSIAAIRGRKANIVYSAAKRGLESYFESLRHMTAGTGIHIQFYRLGYVKTQQSFGKRLLFPAITPQRVARKVLGNMNKDLGAIYLPRYWMFIGLILSKIPWAIFRKLNV